MKEKDFAAMTQVNHEKAGRFDTNKNARHAGAGRQVEILSVGQAKNWPPLAEMVEPVMKPGSKSA